MKKIICILTVCVLLLSGVLLSAADSMSEEKEEQMRITEVCYNPTYMENDKGLGKSDDVFEFVEFINTSDKEISLVGAHLLNKVEKEGTVKEFKNDILNAETSVKPGEVAVILVYNPSCAQTGCGYSNTEELKELYEVFTSFYNCAEQLDMQHFFVAPSVQSKTGEAIEGAGRLANTGEKTVLSIADAEGSVLCSVEYNQDYYNENNRGLVFIYDKEGRQVTGTVIPNPGRIYDNQNPAVNLTPDVNTYPVKVVEYNVCASGIENDGEEPDCPLISDRQEKVFKLINDQNPDLIGLCEVNYAWVEYINAALIDSGKYEAYGYSSQGKAYGKSGKVKWDLNNLLLWSTEKYELVKKGRFWCSSTPSRPNTFKWEDGTVGDFGRCINWVVLKDKATGSEFLFMCQHIDAKVKAARLYSAELITEKALEFAEGRPIIIVGDWNANEADKAYSVLTSGEFADAKFRTYDTDLRATFNKWGTYLEDMHTRLPIDHCIITKNNVFVDKVWQTTGMDEVGSLPSDHNLNVYSLRLLNNAPEKEEETSADTEAPTSEEITSDITEDTTLEASSAEEDSKKEDNTEATTDNEHSGCKSVASVGAIAVCASVCGIGLGLRRKKK